MRHMEVVVNKIGGLFAVVLTAAACSSMGENVGSSNEAITTVFTPEKNVTTGIAVNCGGTALGFVPFSVEIEWRPTSNYAAFFDASTDAGLMS